MKKSSLITVALASLVALVGCNKGGKPKPQPTPVDDRPLLQRLTEDFVEAGFGADALEDIEVVTDEDVEEGTGVGVFQYFFRSMMEYNFGTSIFAGYEYYTELLTPASEEEYYGSSALFNDLFEGSEGEPALLADWDALLDDYDDEFNARHQFYFNTPDYDADNGQGYVFLQFIEYDEYDRFLRNEFFAFATFDYELTLEEFLENVPAEEVEEATAEFNALCEQYKTSEEGALLLNVIEAGSIVAEEEEYGDDYTAEEVADYINDGLAEAGVSLEVVYDDQRAAWTLAAGVGSASDETEETLWSAVEIIASYFPDYLLFVEEESVYGDPTAEGYYDLFGDQSYYYFAYFSTEDNSVTATVISYVINGTLAFQLSIK